jgi:hypothetical protein
MLIHVEQSEKKLENLVLFVWFGFSLFLSNDVIHDDAILPDFIHCQIVNVYRRFKKALCHRNFC